MCFGVNLSFYSSQRRWVLLLYCSLPPGGDLPLLNVILQQVNVLILAQATEGKHSFIRKEF